jgi:excisionase family DNA binding protein
MSKRLEAPDALITLKRAAELGGLSRHTLADAAKDGRLEADMPGHGYLTTRRKLHRYLMHRSRGRIAPLPVDYQVPEGEAPIVGKDV